MPVDPALLDRLARRHADGMPPIRGRRVHRLLSRAFAGFDGVLPARAEDGRALLLAWRDDGCMAACGSDGRGPSAALVVCQPFAGATVTAFHDLLKDSLPVLRWELWHPGLARAFGAIAIDASDLQGMPASAQPPFLAAAAAPTRKAASR